MFGLFGKSKKEQLIEQHETEQALHKRKLSAQERFDEIIKLLPKANQAIKDAIGIGDEMSATSLRKDRAEMMSEFEDIKRKL